jgi:hypothetical protein
MSRNKVASFAEHKAAVTERAAFLQLLDADMVEHPEQVTPLAPSLFRRMDALRSKAEQNRRSELLEG